MKCKYRKKCKSYDEMSHTCNVDQEYYGNGRYAGCYRDMEDKNEN